MKELDAYVVEAIGYMHVAFYQRCRDDSTSVDHWIVRSTYVQTEAVAHLLPQKFIRANNMTATSYIYMYVSRCISAV